jgi:hypothetical protein
MYDKYWWKNGFSAKKERLESNFGYETVGLTTTFLASVRNFGIVTAMRN